jgi:hypothetical protein
MQSECQGEEIASDEIIWKILFLAFISRGMTNLKLNLMTVRT